jgi:hypothetical protein
MLVEVEVDQQAQAELEDQVVVAKVEVVRQ